MRDGVIDFLRGIETPDGHAHGARGLGAEAVRRGGYGLLDFDEQIGQVYQGEARRDVILQACDPFRVLLRVKRGHDDAPPFHVSRSHCAIT